MYQILWVATWIPQQIDSRVKGLHYCHSHLLLHTFYLKAYKVVYIPAIVLDEFEKGINVYSVEMSFFHSTARVKLMEGQLSRGSLTTRYPIKPVIYVLYLTTIIL